MRQAGSSLNEMCSKEAVQAIEEVGSNCARCDAFPRSGHGHGWTAPALAPRLARAARRLVSRGVILAGTTGTKRSARH